MADLGTTVVSSAAERRRWLVLGVIGLAQLMMVLDGSVRVHISTAEALDRL